MAISCTLSDHGMTVTIHADEQTAVPLSDIITDPAMCILKLCNVLNYLEILEMFSSVWIVSLNNCNTVDVGVRAGTIIVENNHTRFRSRPHHSVKMDGVTVINSDLWPANLPKIDPNNAVEYVCQNSDGFKLANVNVEIDYNGYIKIDRDPMLRF